MTRPLPVLVSAAAPTRPLSWHCFSSGVSGELLRKKRREKGGHKDPLLQEISHLQEEVMAQISNLRKEHEAAEKKRAEIEAVALILGLSPSDRPRRSGKPAEQPENRASLPGPKREAEESPERQQRKVRYRWKRSTSPPSW